MQIIKIIIKNIIELKKGYHANKILKKKSTKKPTKFSVKSHTDTGKRQQARDNSEDGRRGRQITGPVTRVLPESFLR